MRMQKVIYLQKTGQKLYLLSLLPCFLMNKFRLYDCKVGITILIRSFSEP